MLHRDAAPGIHRIEDSHTNWYLVEEGDGLVVVDAGVPTSWASLLRAVAQLGRPLWDVRALVLTHAHFDHIGFAERARRELELPVWVHTNDVPLTKHPRRYAYERHPLRYVVSKPRALPIVAGFVITRGLWPKPIAQVRRFGDGDGLAVLSSARVVPTPGHTLGHVALHFPERDALIAGDAVVTLNPYTGGQGPQLVARAATADSERALASLDALAATGAGTVLTGHGPPWTDGVATMVARARAAGLT